MATAYELGTLDPHAENTLASFSILSNVYEPLVTTDEEMRVQPALAETWENPDAFTTIFHLRPSVQFHSGGHLSARDVLFSFNRLLRNGALAARSYTLNVSQIEAVDDSTVRIRTIRPMRTLLSRLSFVLIIPESARPEGLAASPDGTGPYSLIEWRTGDYIRLARNEHYWATKPAFGEVVFFLGRSPEKAADGLLSRSYQLAAIGPASLETSMRADHAVLRRNNLYVKYLGYDMTRAVTPFCTVTPNPFADMRVRRAIHMAIDRRRLVANVSGAGTPATQPVPRFVFGFNPEIPEPPYDPAEARALLRDAGLGQGFEVTLHTRRVLSEPASWLKEQLGHVGIRIDIEVLPDDEYFEALRQRRITFWLDRWGCTTGDATEFLEAVAHSPDPQRGLGVNNEGYANTDMDRAIESIAEIEDVDRRRRAIQALMKVLMDGLVWIPLYHDQDVYAIDRTLAWRPRADSYIRAADIRLSR